MARLLDLLTYLAEPGNERVWVFLDIKIDDDAEELVPRVAEVFSSVPQGNWARRVVLGCWTARFMRLCREVLPGYAVANIGYVGPIAKEYLEVGNAAMNMRQESLFGFGGPAFRSRCEEEGRPVYAWTINDEWWMGWCIDNKIDCVVTDDPRRYLEICAERKKELEAGEKKAPGVVVKVRNLLLCVLYFFGFLILPRALKIYKRLGYPHEVRAELQKLRGS